MGVFPAYMPMYRVHWCQWRLEENIESLGTGVTEDC